MITIDHQLLVELGLGHLTGQQQDIIKRRIYDVLEARVGMILTDSLTSVEQGTFEKIIDESPEAAQQYLASVVPNYGPVVRRELDFIATSIAQSVRRGAVSIGASESHKQDVV